MSALSRKEKALITEIRDAADAYLAAKNHAERYIYARRFGDAILAFTSEATRSRAAAATGPTA